LSTPKHQHCHQQEEKMPFDWIWSEKQEPLKNGKNQRFLSKVTTLNGCNTSTHQHTGINIPTQSSTHQHINTSTHQHTNTIINTSIHQYINTSTHQHINTST
jgi:hypothetical protein